MLAEKQITKRELSRLGRRETTIEKGMQAFIDVAALLREIRDNKPSQEVTVENSHAGLMHYFASESNAYAHLATRLMAKRDQLEASIAHVLRMKAATANEHAAMAN